MKFKRYHHILIPTDFEDHCQAAYELALATATPGHTIITLLHVLPAISKEEFQGLNAIRLMYMAADQRKGEWLKSAEMEAQEKARFMDKLKQELPEDACDGVEIHYAVERGDATTEIARFAEEQDVDLIVLGGQRPGILPKLSGSMARQLARLTTTKITQVIPPLSVQTA